MDMGDPALVVGVAASRGVSRLIVSNGVFALMGLLLLFGSLIRQLAGDQSVP